MAAAYYETILKAVLAVVQGLSLDGIDPTHIVRRKLPKASEVLDVLPLIAVCASEVPEDVEPLSTEDDAAVEVTYAVDVVVIAADQHDFASNEPKYLGWRETIRQAFQSPELPAAPSVFDYSVRMFAPYDRALLNQNYAYIGLSFRFHSAEVKKR